MWEGGESKRRGGREKQVTQGQDSVFAPTRQQLSRENRGRGKPEGGKNIKRRL